MKREKSTARWTRNWLTVCLLVLAGVASARAQVTPTVCFESKPVTLTRTFSRVQFGYTYVTESVPVGFYRFVFNPGGANEETTPIGYIVAGTTLKRAAGLNIPEPPFQYEHVAGETVLIVSDGLAAFGYNNAGSTAVTIQRGVSSGNYFIDGPLLYTGQPSVFQPGRYESVFSISGVSGYTLTWNLAGRRAISTASADQGCGTITYQGRLSDAGNSANGQYDLQFQAFDAETGGIAQSELIALENVPVTNGVFTVPLKFGSTLTNNQIFKFLEIGVRPGTSTDAFTVLTPRQPITSVPYAVNAQNALNATTETQLGGVSAANYLTNSSNFGQSVTTALGTANLTADATTGTYTLVPGLTQTVNVPANSSLVISTDGGISSFGALNTYTVIDVAIFVDGASISQRRIVIGNFPVPSSVGNWTLSTGQTLSAGNHTIEIRARTGIGGGAAAIVSSGGDPLLRGQLTVAIIRK